MKKLTLMPNADRASALTAPARTHSWAQLAWRVLLAGPWTLLAALVVMAGMATWLPPGEAKVNNLVLPLLLFPLIWAALFFHACLARRLRSAAIVSFAAVLVSGGLLAGHMI